MAHPFEVRVERTVNATPEQVWEAVSTAAGLDAWFMGENELKPRLGGAVRTTLHGFTMDSTISTWDPPHRYASTSPEADDGRLMTFAFEIEGRAGGHDHAAVRPQRLPAGRRLGAGVRRPEDRRSRVRREARRVHRALSRPDRRSDHAVGPAGQPRAGVVGVHDRPGRFVRTGGRRAGPFPGGGPAGSRRRDRLRLARLPRPPHARRDVPLHPRDGDRRARPPHLPARRPGVDGRGLAGLGRSDLCLTVRIAASDSERSTPWRP